MNPLPQDVTILNMLVNALPIEYKCSMSHAVMTIHWQVDIPVLTTKLSKTLLLSPHVVFATEISYSVSILTS